MPCLHGPPFAQKMDMTNSEVFPILHGALAAVAEDEVLVRRHDDLAVVVVAEIGRASCRERVFAVV